TGPLHLGHAYSAILAHDLAHAKNGQFLLRIEDIDQSRARPTWEAQIYDDLRWLGLSWPTPAMRQSDRQAAYDAAIGQLHAMGLLYPCACTRRDIAAATSAPQEGAPLPGPDGLIYPGTCRPDTPPGRLEPGQTLRLNMSRAIQHIDIAEFTEEGAGPNGETGTIRATAEALTDTVGDVLIARRDMATSYHLSVVVDDAAQGITHVVRGRDLFEATQIHVLLQRLLGLPTPKYHHHALIRDDQGKRLAKRDDARAISRYRDDGATPADIRALVGL
ncbi:MAG: tRNA glutamyl-Q(34) synthetase GluQRS, partial [Pseudomonadota bacterium]|nr:tRNA glutamyl-Q(34) synthetase GluQRS [Pseudomonadota bacterium]